jgi:hypothetical protein
VLRNAYIYIYIYIYIIVLRSACYRESEGKIHGGVNGWIERRDTEGGRVAGREGGRE